MSVENNISIRQFQEHDWETLKYIRLLALQSDPGVFGGSVKKESALTEEEWRGWLNRTQAGRFGVFNQGEIIGLTGIVL